MAFANDIHSHGYRVGNGDDVPTSSGEVAGVFQVTLWARAAVGGFVVGAGVAAALSSLAAVAAGEAAQTVVTHVTGLASRGYFGAARVLRRHVAHGVIHEDR